MIKYITTLSELESDSTKYYLSRDSNMTMKKLITLTTTDLIATDDKADNDQVGCFKNDKESYFFIHIPATSILKYTTIGSVIFVSQGTPIGFYNFNNLVDISQSSRYSIKINYDIVTKEVLKFQVSTELIKYNPNKTVTDNHLLTDKSLLRSDYLAYSKPYKSVAGRRLIPSSDNRKFSSLGGVLNLEGINLNTVTRFITEVSIDDKIIGGRLLYFDTYTSLVVWSDSKAYLCNDVMKSTEFKVLTTDYKILDCTRYYLIGEKDGKLEVLSAKWDQGSVISYGRMIDDDCSYYIDNLKTDLNIVEILPGRISPRSKSTTQYWNRLLGGIFLSDFLSSSESYIASYKSTFIMYFRELEGIRGITILGEGGIGCIVGEYPGMIPPIMKSGTFLDLLEQGNLDIQFLNEELVHIKGTIKSEVVLDNIIQVGSRRCLDTKEALDTQLDFIRTSEEPITSSSNIIFGYYSAFTFITDGLTTKLKQL